MVPIVAEIIEEVISRIRNNVFHKPATSAGASVEDLTGDASVSIGDVEEHISAATRFVMGSTVKACSEGIL